MVVRNARLLAPYKTCDNLLNQTATDIPQPVNADSIAGRRVAFVGKLGGVNRKEARSVVRRLQGTMVDPIDQSVDLIVVGADVFPSADPENLLDESILRAVAEQKITVVSETQFWQITGVVEPESDVGKLYTPAMLAELLQVPMTTIRRWHRRGLITPTRQIKKLTYFDFEEITSARRIAALVAAGVNSVQIEKQLSQLAELYPDMQRPLSQLSIIVEGRKVLLRQGEGLVEPSGQKRLDFDAALELDRPNGDQPPATISFARAIDSRQQNNLGVAEPTGDFSYDSGLQNKSDFLQLAIALEDDGEFKSAIDVYRSLSLAQGPTADVSFRMAELFYQVNDLAAARERYSMAVEFDEAFVEARANLGCVLVELGQTDLALATFEGALEHHPDYPDVHFHLARLLDEIGNDEQAWQHWARFLELTPNGPWADEARLRIEAGQFG